MTLDVLARIPKTDKRKLVWARWDPLSVSNLAQTRFLLSVLGLLAKTSKFIRCFRGYPRPSEAIRGYLRSSEAIWGHPKPSEAIRCHLGPSDAIRGLSVVCENNGFFLSCPREWWLFSPLSARIMAFFAASARLMGFSTAFREINGFFAAVREINGFYHSFPRD